MTGKNEVIKYSLHQEANSGLLLQPQPLILSVTFWKELSAIIGDGLELKKGIRCLSIGMVVCSLIWDCGILTEHVSAYINKNVSLISPDSKSCGSCVDSNSTNILDERTSLLTKISLGNNNAKEEPAITSITVTPNPSTKGDKVILKIIVDYKNASSLKYSWTEIGNLVVSLNGADTSSPSFLAPHLTADTNVTFGVTVTNEIGRTGSGNITAIIKASNEAVKITSISINTIPSKVLTTGS